MFTYFDNKSFGVCLRAMRLSLGLSRSEVYEKTGITENTLYSMEKGKTIPQITTLLILSGLYCVNLLQLFDVYKDDHKYNSIINSIDSALLDNNVELAQSLLNQIEMEHPQKIFCYFDNIEVDLLSKYLELLILSFSNDLHLKEKVICELKLLLLIHGSFDEYIESKGNKVSNFEIRILLTIGSVLLEIKDFHNSQLIFNFILNRLLIDANTQRNNLKLIVKTFANIIYILHMYDRNEEVVKLSNDTIDFCKKHHLYYLLYFIYIRKGIAEFLTGDDNYMESLNIGIVLLYIENRKPYALEVKNIIKEKYNIELLI